MEIATSDLSRLALVAFLHQPLRHNSDMPLEQVILRNMHHKAHRAGWLRAAVLGVNDGLVSTASLMVGVAASNLPMSAVVTAGIAGVAAGAMAMAVGEYVSVSSQADIEQADTALEMAHLAEDPEGELEELTALYVERGVPHDLARQVAVHMTEKDALGTHLREELGHHSNNEARPFQAAVASAFSFLTGGLVPFIGLAFPASIRIEAIWGSSIIGLFIAGMVAARAAGCGMVKPTVRVVLGGIAAMGVTFAVGTLFHIAA